MLSIGICSCTPHSHHAGLIVGMGFLNPRAYPFIILSMFKAYFPPPPKSAQYPTSFKSQNNCHHFMEVTTSSTVAASCS